MLYTDYIDQSNDYTNPVKSLPLVFSTNYECVREMPLMKASVTKDSHRPSVQLKPD